MERDKLEFESVADEVAFAEAVADITEVHALLDELVALRRAMEKTQTSVARAMGVAQSTVAGFESEMSNPRLSTLQRYARTIGVHIRFKVEGPFSIRSTDAPNRSELSWSATHDKQAGYIWAV